MKKIKNLIIILLALFFSRPLFADINIRWNTIGGPEFYKGFFIINLEVEIEEANTMTIGLEGGLVLNPYIGWNTSWIKCLQPESEKKYRFYMETELHGGINFWKASYITPTGQTIENLIREPFVSVDILFTFKSASQRLYGGIGPSLNFSTHKMDGEWDFKFSPALIIALGLKLTDWQ